ncbi:hypothetical protein ACL9RF_07565 [Sphingobacterium sp. Mn56C]|uniref:hypothetical protein n=1 Tax=Sphingobacterium sp. Mn56C TaxID=3395261 RepID=UPI003BE9196F
MNLGKHIYILLKKQGSVFVKGLGTFKRTVKPATFDAKRNVLLPPVSFIEYAKEETQGADFVNYLQQVSQISHEEALAETEIAVTEILERLKQAGQVDLDSLGHLVLYGNSFVFKPLDLSGFSYTALTDYFSVGEEIPSPPADHTDGLAVEKDAVPPVLPAIPNTSNTPNPPELPDLPDVPDLPAEAPVVEPEPSKPEIQAVEGAAVADVNKYNTGNTEAVEDATHELGTFPLSSNYPVDEYPKAKKTAAGSYIYGILAAVAILVLAGIYYYNTQMIPVPQAEMLPEVMPMVDSSANGMDTTYVVTPDSIHNQSIQDSIQQGIEHPVASVATKPAAADKKYDYQVVIGTHKTMETAEKQVESFHKKGHKSVRAVEPTAGSKLIRVIWDTYETKEKQDSALRFVHKEISADAWPAKIR